jgi:hypothetical protein
MKSVLGKSAVKKTMRVATAFTGAAGFAAAGLAAYAPTAKADSYVPWPYALWVNADRYIYSLQVCGWKDTGGGGGAWTCTAKQHNPYFYGDTCTFSCINSHPAYFGSNWKDGQVNVWNWNSSGKEYLHTCNTNGAYYGRLRGTGNGGIGLSLTGNNNGYPLYVGTSEC